MLRLSEQEKQEIIRFLEVDKELPENAPQKMARLRQWCEDLNALQKEVKYSFVFVDDEGFNKYAPKKFAQLLEGFKAYQC